MPWFIQPMKKISTSHSNISNGVHVLLRFKKKNDRVAKFNHLHIEDGSHLTQPNLFLLSKVKSISIEKQNHLGKMDHP